MPRWSDFSSRMSTLGIGLIFDLFHDKGQVCVRRDKFQIWLRIGVKISACSFQTQNGMPSGPVTVRFMLLKLFQTTPRYFDLAPDKHICWYNVIQVRTKFMKIIIQLVGKGVIYYNRVGLGATLCDVVYGFPPTTTSHRSGEMCPVFTNQLRDVNCLQLFFIVTTKPRFYI